MPAVHPSPSPLVLPAPTLAVRPWPDAVIDEVGHDPRSPYVERFWLGVLGPTACDFAAADMLDFAFPCQRLDFALLTFRDAGSSAWGGRDIHQTHVL